MFKEKVDTFLLMSLTANKVKLTISVWNTLRIQGFSIRVENYPMKVKDLPKKKEYIDFTDVNI